MTPSPPAPLSGRPGPERTLQAGRTRALRPRTTAVDAYLNALRTEPDPQVRLQRGVGLLPHLVHGCHHASVIAVDRGRLEAHVTSDRTSRRADDLQDELDDGPYLQALRTGHGVVAQDLRTETRWVGWCSAVVHDPGVASVLSVLLPTPRPTAVLSLYSDAVLGLADVDLALLHTVADPLAAALLDVRVGTGRLGPAA